MSRVAAFFRGSVPTAAQTRGGIVTSLPAWPTGQAMANPAVVPRVLPLRVWWPAFVANSAFYGFFVWLLLAGAWYGRRRRALR